MREGLICSIDRKRRLNRAPHTVQRAHSKRVGRCARCGAARICDGQDNAGATGNTDPSEQGAIDANGSFSLRWKLRNFRVSDFYIRGTLDASGLRASGGLFQSGFNGQTIVFDKISD